MVGDDEEGEEVNPAKGRGEGVDGTPGFARYCDSSGGSWWDTPPGAAADALSRAATARSSWDLGRR